MHSDCLGFILRNLFMFSWEQVVQTMFRVKARL